MGGEEGRIACSQIDASGSLQIMIFAFHFLGEASAGAMTFRVLSNGGNCDGCEWLRRIARSHRIRPPSWIPASLIGRQAVTGSFRTILGKAEVREPAQSRKKLSPAMIERLDIKKGALVVCLAS
ncbi:hypothetical protein ACFX5Q_22265 [Mesorhizobium sp. IMUNJ 23033]|uniref:hypothetical protein n=1 Tax=Mesorhizobium sp. IMUNJ 23033 TaxID=3378039 RepID=UPI00384E851C